MIPAATSPKKFSWSWKQIKELLATTYSEWSDIEAPRMGASLAYYTILSLAPLLIVVIAVAGLVFGEQAARGALAYQIQDLVGGEGAKAIQSVIQQTASQKTTGTFASIAGFLALLFGASSVALELRSALDKIWRLKAASGVSGFIKERSYALAVVLGAGFLLLASLVVSAALASMETFFGNALPVPAWAAEVINALISVLVISGVLACIFKLLPATRITWHDVRIGAIFTGILFTVGKTLIGLYLGRASVGSSYGAAGSLVVVLVWIYYSSQILFFGAEFTRVFAHEYGSMPGPLESRPAEPKAAPATTSLTTAALPAHTPASFTHSVGRLVGSAAGLGVSAVKVFKGEAKAGNGAKQS